MNDFKVSFGTIAHTLMYEDSQGTVYFTFDLSPAGDETNKRWNLHLNSKALDDKGNRIEFKSTDERARLKDLIERVAEYAKSRGYIVLLSD